MTLLSDEGDTALVTGNAAYTQHARTYKLTAADLHTYYVLAGDTPVLVHNSTCPAISMDEAGSKVAAFDGGKDGLSSPEAAADPHIPIDMSTVRRGDIP